jgi:hypothetical protein
MQADAALERRCQPCDGPEGKVHDGEEVVVDYTEKTHSRFSPMPVLVCKRNGAEWQQTHVYSMGTIKITSVWVAESNLLRFFVSDQRFA